MGEKLYKLFGLIGSLRLPVTLQPGSGANTWELVVQAMSGDIDDEYKKSVRDFDRYQKKQTAGRKNSFLTDIKYKSLESILGGQKVRNMLSSINFK